MGQDKIKNREAVKKHYDANKEYYIEKNRKSRQKRRDYVRELKNAPCTDCGNKYPHYIMEFDHIQKKYKHVSSLAGSSWKKLKEEIAKCELVCANCHAERTWSRRVQNGEVLE